MPPLDRPGGAVQVIGLAGDQHYVEFPRGLAGQDRIDLQRGILAIRDPEALRSAGEFNAPKVSVTPTQGV